MIDDLLEREYWYRLHALSRNESVFQNGCAAHIAAITLPRLNVRYSLNGVEYQAGEKSRK